MSQDDIQALSQIAQGDGELRVSKRLMRDLIERILPASTGRAVVPPHRIARSVN